MKLERIHTVVIPRLQALLWTVALIFEAILPQYIKNDVYANFAGAVIILVVFLWESALFFVDVKAQYEYKNFSGNIFSLNVYLFTILPIIFILTLCYLIWRCDIYFYLMILSIGWTKYEIMFFANNIEAVLIDIKPEFKSNSINK